MIGDEPYVQSVFVLTQSAKDQNFVPVLVYPALRAVSKLPVAATLVIANVEVGSKSR